MGFLRAFIISLIIFSHDLFFSKILKNTFYEIFKVDFFEQTIFLLICFIFIETGFIVSKQINFGTYNSISTFLISRLSRILIPSYIGLFFAFIVSFFYPPLFSYKNYNEEILTINNLNYISQIFLIFIEISLQHEILFHLNIFNHAFTFNSNLGIEAFRLSNTPHFWTISGDLIFMIILPFIIFKKYYKLAVFFITIIFSIQYYMYTINEFESLFWQNHFNTFLCLFIGYLIGIYNLKLPQKIENFFTKNKLLIFFISFLFLIFGILFFYYFKNFFIYIVILFYFSIICSFMWISFAYNSIDMKTRDIFTYFYILHWTFFTIYYYYFKPNFYASIICLIISFIISFFTSSFFEKYNKKNITYLKKRFK